VSTETLVPEKQVSRGRWWIHLILIGGYVAAAIPLGLLQPRRQPALLATTHGLLIVCAWEIGIFGVIFGLGWLTSRASAEQLLLKWRQGWWTIPLGIGYSIVLRIAVAIIVSLMVAILLLTGLVPRESLAQFSEQGRTAVERIVNISAMRHNRAYFWLTVTVASFVVAGLREELWRSGTLAAMRALWPALFEGRDGQIAAVALIAIVFGLAHLTLGLLPAAMAMILGFLLGIIMILHQSIWPAVIAHGMFDATSFAIVPIALQHLHRAH
jgi:membrane protease YdiL (CAAX protease family)